METVKGIIEFEIARADPSRVFDSPQAIADAPYLTDTQKLRLLRSWKLDELRLHGMEGDGMAGGANSRAWQIQYAIDCVHRQTRCREK